MTRKPNAIYFTTRESRELLQEVKNEKCDRKVFHVNKGVVNSGEFGLKILSSEEIR